MSIRNTFLLVLTMLLTVVFSTAVSAADKSRQTVITVGEMCGGCAKRITAKLEPIANVERVKCDTKKNRVFVVSVEDRSLSPRKLWISMEEIGKTPKKLIGPAGTFTSRPKR